MKIVNENSNKYRRVRDTLFGDNTSKIKTFAIISADNPLGWKNSTDEELAEKYRKWLNNPHEYNRLSRSQIKDRVKNLHKTGEQALKYGNFDFVQLKGHYGNAEKSYMIFNLPLVDAKLIASEFGQESFFFGRNEINGCTVAYYKTKNDSCSDYSLIEISNTITNEEDANDFFSKFGLKFKINMREFGDNVTPVENDGYFEESMDEDPRIPFKYRASRRKMSKEK